MTTSLRLAYHEAGHCVMAYLCGIKFSRVAIMPGGPDPGGVTSLLGRLPASAETSENLRLLQKRVLILVAGKAAEEKLWPGITNLLVAPIHLHDYVGECGAYELISRCTGLTGGAVNAELEHWERRAGKVFVDDCILGALCRIASMLDAAEMVDGEKHLDGVDVSDILAGLIPNERREALSKDAFG